MSSPAKGQKVGERLPMEDRIAHTYNVPDVKIPQKEIIAILEDTVDIWSRVGKAFVQKINFHIKSKQEI